jgi:hypothetical protein
MASVHHDTELGSSINDDDSRIGPFVFEKGRGQSSSNSKTSYKNKDDISFPFFLKVFLGIFPTFDELRWLQKIQIGNIFCKEGIVFMKREDDGFHLSILHKDMIDSAPNDLKKVQSGALQSGGFQPLLLLEKFFPGALNNTFIRPSYSIGTDYWGL